MICLLETSPFIDVTLCQQYFVNTTVLCEYLTTANGELVSKTAWSFDNYEYELDRIVDELEQLQQRPDSSVYFNQTENTFLVVTAFLIQESDTYMNEYCFCTTDNCNNNLAFCLAAETSTTLPVTSHVTSRVTSTTTSSVLSKFLLIKV